MDQACEGGGVEKWTRHVKEGKWRNGPGMRSRGGKGEGVQACGREGWEMGSQCGRKGLEEGVQACGKEEWEMGSSNGEGRDGRNGSRHVEGRGKTR